MRLAIVIVVALVVAAAFMFVMRENEPRNEPVQLIRRL